MLRVLPPSCATNLYVAKSRPRFYFLQHENLLRKVVIRETNHLNLQRNTVTRQVARKMLPVLLGLNIFRSRCMRRFHRPVFFFFFFFLNTIYVDFKAKRSICYYIDRSVLLESTPLHKIHIYETTSGTRVAYFPALVRILMASFPAFAWLFVQTVSQKWRVIYS